MKRLGKQAVTRAVDEALAGTADLEYQTRITADRCTLAFNAPMGRKPKDLAGSPLFPITEPEPQGALFQGDEEAGGISFSRSSRSSVADSVWPLGSGGAMPIIADNAEAVAWATWTHAVAILAAADTEVNHG